MGVIYTPIGQTPPAIVQPAPPPPVVAPPPEKPPTFTGFVQPSVFTQPGWVNPHVDTMFNLAPPGWKGAGLYVELQPWDLITAPKLNWPQLIVSSPRLDLGGDASLQVRGGKFDRDYSILPTPSDVLDFDETTLTPSTTLMGSIEVFGGQARLDYADDDVSLVLSGGGYAGLAAEGHAPDSIGLGAFNLNWSGDDAAPGGFAVGAGVINASLLSDQAPVDDATDIRATSILVQGGLHQSLIPGGGPFGFYGAVLTGFQGEPTYDDIDVQMALAENPEDFPGSNFHLIPKVGILLNTEFFDLDASAGQHWNALGADGSWQSAQEFGATAIISPVPDTLQLVAVGTLVTSPEEVIPMIEGKVKWLFDVK